MISVFYERDYFIMHLKKLVTAKYSSAKFVCKENMQHMPLVGFFGFLLCNFRRSEYEAKNSMIE